MPFWLQVLAGVGAHEQQTMLCEAVPPELETFCSLTCVSAAGFHSIKTAIPVHACTPPNQMHRLMQTRASLQHPDLVNEVSVNCQLE